MKITKWVDFSKEIEIELSTEDISHIYRDPGETLESKANSTLSNFNSIAKFLIGTTNEVIDILTPKQREIISRFLGEQAERFK